MLSSQTLFIIILALICNALGSVLFKKGASRRKANARSGTIGSVLVFAGNMLSNREIILGILLQIAAMIGWLVFISRVALSFAFPLSSISNVTILLASHYLLHERISPRRWSGVLLILGGIALIANT
ncbi:MAG TPA: EamA family transporter [Novimethylophilus sp.]|uniref:EamA family transporter n=1 Tax=Novimethylophilus sp. TaxID=2137426 RepID=UPI002F420599